LRTSEGADEEWNGFETAVHAFDDRHHIHLIGNWYFIQLLAYCFSCVRGTRQWQWWSSLLRQYAHDMVGGAGLITHMRQLVDNGDTPITTLDEAFPQLRNQMMDDD
jgi:hypothetical protein